MIFKGISNNISLLMQKVQNYSRVKDVSSRATSRSDSKLSALFGEFGYLTGHCLCWIDGAGVHAGRGSMTPASGGEAGPTGKGPAPDLSG